MVVDIRRGITELGANRAVLARRSFWRCMYTDGKVINEWDRIDWSEIPRKGRKAVRLCCPNSQVATLDYGKDATGRLFQFKVAIATVAVSPIIPGTEPYVEIFRKDTQEIRWEYSPKEGTVIGKIWDRTLAAFTANSSKYLLSHVIGLVLDTDGNCVMCAWEYSLAPFGSGKLVQGIMDNVYDMKYHQQGRLSADVLGLDTK